jgi:asparagine synthase (glutamine-hydrolysing)
MCGIAGIVRASPAAPVDEAALRRMVRALRHRGPDGWGLALDAGAGLAATRLAMVGIEDGWQPMEGERSVLVYNGEVFNHVELGAGLDLRTHADTEVVLRLLERDGAAALHRCIGQFAFAWWEPAERRLTLARDRFGVRPLLYAAGADGSFVFASEARALFASGEVEPAPDLEGLDEVFTLWGARAPRTVFAGVSALPPGGLLVWQDGRVVEERLWYEPRLGADAGAADPDDLEPLLRDAVRIRLRADVPVGAYLSGGLDSSVVTALAADAHPQLRTFSVAFEDPRYDESAHQLEVAAALGTEHHVVRTGPAEIADVFEDVVEHAETPLVRTAPAPLYALARATRALGITAVLTGEGADELFWGYDLFKEVQLRRARDWAGLDALYPQIGGARRGDAWRQAFAAAGPDDDPLFSHQTRINATSAVRSLYRADLGVGDGLERLRASLPEEFGRWSALERAQWLELRTLLEPYLLSAQADRVSLAHGVEGRFPFLDHRVFEHAAALPPEAKLAGMDDKIALRAVGRRVLPGRIAERRKQPYRAPEVAPFFDAAGGSPEWVSERLATEALADAGIFDPARVATLVRRCRAGRATGVREGMALIGVLSTQVWHARCLRPRVWPEESARPRVRLDLRLQPARSN